MGVLHFDFPVESATERSALLSVAVVGLLVAAVGAAGICTLPSARPEKVSFISPCFPYLPLFAIAINLYLLASLDKWTWLRFAVWCALGTVIYLGYGIHHSTAALVGSRPEVRHAAAEVEVDDTTNTRGSINDRPEDDASEIDQFLPLHK